MAQFDYSKKLSRLMCPEIMSALGNVREHRGRQSLYIATTPDILNSLEEVARIQSTGASNRIENISTTDKRLRELVEQKIEPRNRDERETSGYRYVLDMIHERHDNIPVTPGVILQFHWDLYRYLDVSFAGRWKDTDNTIAERLPSGELVTRFAPTPSAATPDAVQEICDAYANEIKKGIYDPLLVSLVFVFDFVSIHPFNDGNGRMSRLLTLLLLYQNGYTVGKYVSIEAEIEKSKETYYEALRASSTGRSEGKKRLHAVHHLPARGDRSMLRNARFSTLPALVERIQRKRAQRLLRFLGRKRKQTRDHGRQPHHEQRTIERLLQKLQAEGRIEKVGAARATRYRKTR